MKYLFIAEKPSAMKAVRDAYNSSNKPLGDIDFFAVSGHLCKLCEPKEYEKWNVKWWERELPMVPEPFKVGALNKGKLDELKTKLARGNYDAIIVGTDSDVEGNGIYDLIATYLHLEGYKTLRFFETDLTPKGIMSSMAKLTDFHSNQRETGMTDAFRIRSRFDWLIGFNMTVAYTVKSGFLMKVGRVKAPTLKLVYDNCREIENFTSSTAYQPSIRTEEPEMTAGLIGDDGKPLSFTSRDEAKEILNSLTGNAKVVVFETKTKSTQPDQLFKLSDIQYEAGRTYGYSPERTLELIQSLYEKHKVISYPRTDGRYISSEKGKELGKLLVPVKKTPELAEFAKAITKEDIAAVQKNSRYVNDAEVQKTSHDALIPTGEVPDFGKMTADEKNICLMIFRRFLSMFMKPLVEEKTKCILEDAGNRFSCTGSKVIDPGYTVLYSVPKNTALPTLTIGQVIEEAEQFLHEVVSKPPARLTQASLIKAMENIQKYMSAGEYKEAMKKAKGIGQPSSRAAIIADLITTGYMEERGSGKTAKGLYITQLGKEYIENLAGSSIVNPELSAEWEVYMSNIREGTMTYEEVYPKILEYVEEVLRELDKLPIKRKSNKEEVGTCPVCGKPVVKLKKGYCCSGYPDCSFSIWKEVAGKELTEKQMKLLLSGKETGVIQGFKKKDGSEFSASLILKDGKVTWKSGREEVGTCPICGKPVIKLTKGYCCTGYPDCRFSIWKEVAGKELTERQMKLLLAGKETGVIQGFKKKDGSEFSASLILKDGKVGWAPREAESGLKCPKCGKPLMESPEAFSCQGRKDETCDFIMWRRVDAAGRMLTKREMKDMIEKGKTQVLEGLVGKSGKTFAASITLDPKTFKRGMEFQKTE